MIIHVKRERDYPDVGNADAPCCYGSAFDGPGGCTCWKPEYNQEQAERRQGPMRVRRRKCADCAFRPNSPERQGDERYAHSGEDGLEELMSGGVFVCHVGLRRLIRERHPSGVVMEAMPGAYSPPMPPCKADGSPAEYCAGWASELRRRARKAKP